MPNTALNQLVAAYNEPEEEKKAVDLRRERLSKAVANGRGNRARSQATARKERKSAAAAASSSLNRVEESKVSRKPTKKKKVKAAESACEEKVVLGAQRDNYECLVCYELCA